jgi:thiol:disulfide interchange protein
MRVLSLALLLAASLPALAAGLPALAAQAPKPAVQGPFDPARHSFKDLEAAKAEAQRSGRRILLDVGGNWCPWCHKLHAFWAAQPELKKVRDQGFVFLLVDFSKDHKNEAFLGQFPKVKGYPHLYVLDAQGKLLHSQGTGELEHEGGYSAEKIGLFLKSWKP